MIWWNWLAKEVNKHPSDKMSPPTTAVILVDFLLQTATVRGDMKRDTDIESAPTEPVTSERCDLAGEWRHLVSVTFTTGHSLSES